MEIMEMQIHNIREFMIWLNGFEHSFKEDSIGIAPNSAQYRMIKSKLDLVTKCFDILSDSSVSEHSFSVINAPFFKDKV